MGASSVVRYTRGATLRREKAFHPKRRPMLSLFKEVLLPLVLMEEERRQSIPADITRVRVSVQWTLRYADVSFRFGFGCSEKDASLVWVAGVLFQLCFVVEDIFVF